MTHFTFDPELMLTDGDLIKEFLVDKLEYYEKYRYFLEGFCSFMGDGLLFVEGEKWKKQRRIIA